MPSVRTFSSVANALPHDWSIRITIKNGTSRVFLGRPDGTEISMSGSPLKGLETALSMALAGRDAPLEEPVKFPALEDDDPIPFGKYAHEKKLMRDVPASYLHWLWSDGKKNDTTCPVAGYIRKNLTALQREFPDGIW